MDEIEIKNKFESLSKMKALKIQKMEGYSNLVFKIFTESNDNYIFKKILSKGNNPFKSREKSLLVFIRQIWQNPIFESEEYFIEKAINCNYLSDDYINQKNNCLYIMRSISKFNKLHKTTSEKPNLFYILENYGDSLFQEIYKNLAQENQEVQVKIKNNLEKVNCIIDSIKHHFDFECLVLSHNDIYFKNILFDLDVKNHVLIDFEYVGFNPFGMDVFSFLNEKIMDYNENSSNFLKQNFNVYPPENEVKEMIKFYIFFYEFESKYKNWPDNEFLISEIRNSNEFQSIDQNRIEKVFQNFDYFGVIVNSFWFYWCLEIGRKNKHINFDYYEFSNSKMEMILHFHSKIVEKKIKK